MDASNRLIRSGFAPMDAALGGLQEGGLHLLAGAPGTAKTAAVLLFLRAALARGETAVLVTGDEQAQLEPLALHLGIDIAAPWREGRLIVLRQRPEFLQLMARAADARDACDELRASIGDARPARLAVDSVGAFLVDGPAGAQGMLALAELLRGSGATTLATYPGDLAATYDRRLEPLTQRAAVVARLEQHHAERRLVILKSCFALASASPVRFALRPGSGAELAPRDANATDAADAAPAARRTIAERRGEPTNRLLLRHAGPTPPEAVAALLRRYYEVLVEPVEGAADPAPAPDVDAVLVATSHETCDAALQVVRDHGHGPREPPIVVVVPYSLRSRDRARFLRAGADEFLSGDLGPAELLARLEAAVRRGRGRPPLSRGAEALVLQPVAGGAPQPLDAAEFSRAVAAHVAHDHPVQYTVVSFRPAAGDARALADVVMGAMRRTAGDLAAVLDDRVAVYLHGARRAEAAPFVERVAGRWERTGRGAVRAETLAYPSDEPQLRALMRAEERS